MAYAFVFQSDLYCENCAARFMAGRVPPGVVYDSNDWPTGPFPDGGGEADSPAHCGGCHAFLASPLTPDGLAYVRDALADFAANGRGSFDVLTLWADFYGMPAPCRRLDPTPPVSCLYGAPMGRAGHDGPATPGGRFYLRAVRLDSGGYDSGGAYWGHGGTLYWASDYSGAWSDYFRASSRADAMAQVRAQFPAARFFNQAKD